MRSSWGFYRPADERPNTVKTTEVGIFLNDAAVSKLEYYLSTSCWAKRHHPWLCSVTTSIHNDQLRRPR